MIHEWFIANSLQSLVGNLRGSENLTTAGLKILSQTEPANICLESSGPLKSFLPVFMRMDSFFVQVSSNNVRLILTHS